MSMHKKPLTMIEEMGLIVYGMGGSIGIPSQSADIFRSGIAWATMANVDRIESAKQLLAHGMPFDAALRERLNNLLFGDGTESN